MGLRWTFVVLVLLALGLVAARAQVGLGIDLLESRRFEPLRGQRVGLLTHAAGVNRQGVPTWQVLHDAPQVNLVALFGPEHGIDGTAGAEAYVQTRVHKPTGLTVYSLYGPTRVPTAAMLERIDTLVIDLQDLGSRSYTYVSAMKLALEACVRAGKGAMVLDRPNPLGGLKVDGPGLDAGLESYVGAFPVPYVHGLTIGEIARMAVAETGWLDLTEAQRRQARLTIVPMTNWRRSMLWPDTGLTWVPTSPAIPDFPAAAGYAMTGLGCQIGGFRHGYGGPYPFRLLSHPSWTSGMLERRLNALQMPGLRFQALRFADGERTREGVYVLIEDWTALRPTEVSFHLMRLAVEANGGANPFANATDSRALLFNKHTGSEAWWTELTQRGADARVVEFVERWSRAAKAFQEQSRRYWLYE